MSRLRFLYSAGLTRSSADSQGVTHRFILNGLSHANDILGKEAFRPSEWRVIGEYVHDEQGGYHQAFVSPIHTTVVMGETVKPYERIKIEQSWKFAEDEAESLWQSAGLVESCRWKNGSKEHGKMITQLSLPAPSSPELLPEPAPAPANKSASLLFCNEQLQTTTPLSSRLPYQNIARTSHVFTQSPTPSLFSTTPSCYTSPHAFSRWVPLMAAPCDLASSGAGTPDKMPASIRF